MKTSLRLFSSFMIVSLAGLLYTTPLKAANGKVTVLWDNIPSSELGGYTVVWGDLPGSYSNSRTLGLVNSVTLELEAERTYYFAVRGLDKNGRPGLLSEPVSALVRPIDTEPPLISNLKIGNVTDSSATFSFTTNELAFVQAQYGPKSNLGTFSGLTSQEALSHTISLSNLQSHTTYYVRVIAKDLFGNQSESEILTVRTEKGPGGKEDPNAPIKFTQISLSNVSNNSVTISWTTDKPTTGLLRYGQGNAFDHSARDSMLATTHIQTLRSLRSSTMYRYKITATDSESNEVTSGGLRFKTADQVSRPARPSKEAIFISSVVEDDQTRTNLGVNNYSEVLANVNLTLVDSQGIVLGTKIVQVPPNGLRQVNSVGRFLDESQSTGDIQANVYLESDQPVKAWASQIDNGSDDPSVLLSTQVGSSRLLIPSTANIHRFRSSLVLMNLEMTPTRVWLTAYDVHGQVTGQNETPVPVPAYGVVSIDNVLESLGVKDSYGPLEIRSERNAELIATSRVVASDSGSGGFFEGQSVAEASLVQTIPHVEDTPGYRTNAGINNTSGLPAVVRVSLLGAGGIVLGAKTVSVAPLGMTQLNHVVRYLLDREELTNSEGYLRLESDQPVLGWVSQINNVTNDPAFSISKTQGSNRLLIQSSSNMPNFHSSLAVVNNGSGTAIVDIVARGEGGEISGEMRNIAIPPAGFFASPNILQKLGVISSFGPLEIVSTNGQPLLATSRVFSRSGTSCFFEGQPFGP